MAIDFKCICGREMSVQPLVAGKVWQCPDCRHMMAIPTEGAEEDAEQSAAQGSPAWLGHKGQTLDVRCAKCGSVFHKIPWHLGMRCPACESPKFVPTEYLGASEALLGGADEDDEAGSLAGRMRRSIGAGPLGALGAAALVILTTVIFGWQLTGLWSGCAGERKAEGPAAEVLENLTSLRAADQRQAVEQLDKMGDDALEAIKIELRSADQERRARAIYALGRLRSKESLILLLRQLDSPDFTDRVMALVGLKERGEAEGLGPLTLGLSDEHYEVRRAAAAMLGRLGSKNALPALAKMKQDKSRAVREWAARSVKMIRKKHGLGDE